MEQQRPTSPPRAQEWAAGAQIHVAQLGYSCPSSHTPITQLTSSALGAFSPASFYTPPVCDCVICLKFVSSLDGRPMSGSVSHFSTKSLLSVIDCDARPPLFPSPTLSSLNCGLPAYWKTSHDVQVRLSMTSYTVKAINSFAFAFSVPSHMQSLHASSCLSCPYSLTNSSGHWGNAYYLLLL
jgi:hypothetical protein